MPSHFDSTGAQFAWDSTSLKAASTCQRYYLYSMLESFEGEPSVHLMFGGLYATALEHYHKHRALGVEHDAATVLVVREALISTWVHNTKDGERIAGTGHALEFPPDKFGRVSAKSRETLIRTIIWYLEENEESEVATFITAEGKPAVEFSFAFEVDNDIIFTGHMDRLIEFSGIFGQDQKTTGGALSAYYFEQYDTDIQMSMYTFAGRAIYRLPVKGMMIDAASIHKDHTDFMRGFTYRDEARLNEWYSTMLALIATTQANTQRWRQDGLESHFPMNLASCGNYGGCPFRKVCSTTPSLRDRFKRSNLQRRAQPWNPLEAR